MHMAEGHSQAAHVKPSRADARRIGAAGDEMKKASAQ